MPKPERNVLYLAIIAVTGGVFWSIGHTRPQTRGGPAPEAATVVFERRTASGIAIQQVYAYDGKGNSVFSRTIQGAGTMRRVKNRETGVDQAFNDTLGTVIEKPLSRNDKRYLDTRYLGNDPDCEQSHNASFSSHFAEPAINTILNYKVVKKVHLAEFPACPDGTCSGRSMMAEVWIAPGLGCLPLRERNTYTNQQTGAVESIFDQTAVRVTRAANDSLFQHNNARRVKPTEYLRLQAERDPRARENLQHNLKRARDARLDERAY